MKLCTPLKGVLNKVFQNIQQASYWEKPFELAGIPNDNTGDDGRNGYLILTH